MIEVQEQQVEDILQDAIQRITTSGKDFQLVSITKKIQTTNPVHFFEAALRLNKERVFWTSAKESFTMTGVGNAFEMDANENRFSFIESAWEQLRGQAVIYNPYEVPGTGLVSLGGMDFDPEKKRTELWGDFPSIYFTVPEYLLTKFENECYLTVNIKITKEDHVIQLSNQIRNDERILLSLKELEKQPLEIVQQHDIAPDQWKQIVQKATEEISHDQVDKVVLAREVRLKLNRDVNRAAVIEKLIATQSNSYVFAFEQKNSCFIGASPERLVKIKNKELLSTCLAGTAPRGKTNEQDKKIANALMQDMKNRQEHDFVVQMIKQGVAKYCEQVYVPEVPIIYPLKNLQHLYTPVTGVLKQGHSIFDIVSQLHPTPALGGLPRTASMLFIRENELLDRGWYGAPVGWFDYNENGEFAVAIRSGLIQKDEASLFAGCGVVKDSQPEEEFEETRIKFAPMLSVLGGES
ncbi:isochorismate synthase [Virgibacillus salexigens]|uniref:Isochorismate synthase MenF n=1 Tax=Virgibacillus massiliensis TaxID=1462526 RepID=A0A024Q9R3_9BACI|nr:isochorismate synthase [Virgibacillus massiliensis]CDQ39239.1 Isochorismate synthase EntC [Virgibacillus massiliensis]